VTVLCEHDVCKFKKFPQQVDPDFITWYFLQVPFWLDYAHASDSDQWPSPGW